MFELNGVKYSLEQVQAAADKSKLSLDDYISEFKLTKVEDLNPTMENMVSIDEETDFTNTKKDKIKSIFGEKPSNKFPVVTKPPDKDVVESEQYEELKNTQRHSAGTTGDFMDDLAKVPNAFSYAVQNVPLRLQGGISGLRAMQIDVAREIDGAYADDKAISPSLDVNVFKQKELAFIDPETDEQVIETENPELYGELEKRFNNLDNRVKMVYSGTDIEPGYMAAAAWHKNVKEYIDLEAKRLDTGSGVIKGIKGLAYDITGAEGLEGYDKFGIYDVLGGVMQIAADAYVSYGMFAATRGASLTWDIAGPMYVDYNIAKAESLYGGSDDPLAQLAANDEIDMVNPLMLAAPAMALERLGFKKVRQYMTANAFTSRAIPTLLGTASAEALTEWGQFGAERVNEHLATLVGKSGNPTLDQVQESLIYGVKQLVTDEGQEAFLSGLIGGKILGVTGRKINRALRNNPDGTRLINNSLKALNDKNRIKYNTRNKKVQAAIDLDIETITTELKQYLNNNLAIAKDVTLEQRKQLLQNIDKKDKLFNELSDLNEEYKNDEVSKANYNQAKRAITRRSKLIDRNLSNIREEIVGEQLEEGIKEVESTAKKLGFDKLNIFETAKEFTAQTGRPDNVDGFIDEAGQIYINKEVAKQTGTISVAQHELLHKILNNQFSDKTQVNKLVDDFKNSLPSEQLTLLEERVKGNYDSKYLKENPDEYFTVYASLLKDGDIQADETVLTKIKDNFILPVLRKFGFAKADFDSGVGIRNFIQEYSRDTNVATQSVDIKSEGTRAITGDKLSTSAADKVNNTYKNKGIEGAFEIIEEYRPMAKKIASNFRDVPGYTTNQDILVEEILTGNRGVYDLISEFNPSKGVPLAAYINKYLKSRAIESANRILDTKFTTDVTEARNVTATETAEDVVTQKETKQKVDKAKPKTLRKKLNIDQDLIKTVKAAVKKAFGTKLPDVNSKKFKDALSKMYKVELKKPIADLMGTRDTYKTFLENNWKAVYDAMPVSTLVKFERMKSPSDRVFTKVVKTNISPTEVDQAIKDRKLPFNVSRNSGPTLYEKVDVNESDFVNHFIGDDVAPSTKGTRKDALAEAIGEELAFDATPEVSQTKEVAEKTKAIRELEGKKETKEETQEQTALLGKQIDRDMESKFSVSQSIINTVFELPIKGADKLLENYIGRNTIKVKSKEDIKQYIDQLKKDVFVLGPKELWFGPRTGTAFTSSSKILGLTSKDKLWIEFKKQIQALKDDKNIKYGKAIPGIENLSIPAYKTLFPNSEQINENIKNGKIKEFNKKVSTIHKTLWKRINESIKKDKKAAVGIATYLKIVAHDTNHWHKLGAEFVGYSQNVKTRYEYEHAMPATAAYLYLLDASLAGGNFNAAYDAVMDNYKLIALDKAMDDKLRLAKLQRGMPKGWRLIENYWWQRYFNEEVAKQDGGIDTRSIIFTDGKTAFDKFKVGANGQLTTLQILKDQDKAGDKNSRTFPQKLSRSSSLKQIEILKNYDEAADKARSLKTPEKGISVFDFDDTLAKTNSKVLYTLPNGKKGKLSATEFAVKSKALEDQGAIFDFSQFNKVVGGKKGPLADLALKRQGKFGSKDIFILTARPQQSAQAIKAFLDGIGLSIPLNNITGLEDGTPQAKFSKSENLNKEFNIIIEKKTGLGRNKIYSPARAKTVGASKGKYNFWIPYSAEDFVGLMYTLLGKGKEGDAQMAWFKKNFFDPFNRAENAITKDKITVSNDFKELKKEFKTIPKTLKKEAIDGFTYENALRVYIWNKQSETIPGLTKKDIKELTGFINKDGNLKTFANELITIQKGKPYPKPTETWLSGTLTTDIIGGINTINRSQYLQEWQENIDIVFSKENMNKLEATQGKDYVDNLRNIINRMKTGSNKSNAGSKIVNDVLDWVNGSVGAIMFLNTRSAVLQTISAINFINWSDNNVLAAGKAFANQKQYWKDFNKLFNSDFLVSRRKGLKINVTESEIADAAEKGSAKGVISMILKKGFVFTQLADSFAIASGGATFYRNRLNTLVKNGMSESKAKNQAFLDFYDVAEESQQSSRTDRISAQQASSAGRVILAFGNTPMQYGRLMKKAFLDLKNNRGDNKTNISKIIYYGLVQNILFNAIQNALFVMLFDDEDEIPQDKVVRVANGMIDSILRGLGIGGAAVSTFKNIVLKILQESDKKSPKYEDAALEILDLSPPISSKVSKLRSAGRTISWNQKEINEKGFSLDNPAYLAGAQVLSATTNIPLDRVIKKGNNIADAVSDESEYWQKIALLSGWSMWELQPPKPSKSKRKSNNSKGKKRTTTW